MRLGIIGTGTISAAIVRGLKSSDLADWPVILSPRNAALARELATLSGVRIGEDNQSVVDASELVLLAVRPQVAEDVLSRLSIPAGTPVISLIAATPIERIAAWTGAAQVCRAIPLPFVESRSDVIPVFPPRPEAMQLFGALGTALAVTDQATFDTYAALSALMGSYFGILGIASAWAEAQGLPPADARAYLTSLFANLGQTAKTSPHSLDALRKHHSTAGGLNEQVFVEFTRLGGGEALTTALDGVLRRARGAH